MIRLLVQVAVFPIRVFALGLRIALRTILLPLKIVRGPRLFRRPFRRRFLHG